MASAIRPGSVTSQRERRRRNSAACEKPSVCTKPGKDGVHGDPMARERRPQAAREGELSMLRRHVRAGACERDRARDRHDVDDVGAARPLQPGQKRARAPDAAEVVDGEHALDEIEVGFHKGVPRRHAGVVDEQMDRGMPREHARGGRLDRRAVADVAQLDLAADLVCKRPQPLLTPRDEDAVPARAASCARGGLADPRRGARDDRDRVDASGTSRRAYRRIAP